MRRIVLAALIGTGLFAADAGAVVLPGDYRGETVDGSRVSFEATAKGVTAGRFGRIPMQCERRRDGELVPGPDFRGFRFSSTKQVPVRKDRFKFEKSDPDDPFEFGVSMVGDFIGKGRAEGIIFVTARLNRRGRRDRNGRSCASASVDWTATVRR